MKTIKNLPEKLSSGPKSFAMVGKDVVEIYNSNGSIAWKITKRDFDIAFDELIKKQELISNIHFSQMKETVSRKDDYLDWEEVLRRQFELLVKSQKETK